MSIMKKGQVSQKVFLVSCWISRVEVCWVRRRIRSGNCSGASDWPPVMAARLSIVAESAEALSSSRSCWKTRNLARAVPSLLAFLRGYYFDGVIARGLRVAECAGNLAVLMREGQGVAGTVGQDDLGLEFGVFKRLARRILRRR